MHKGGSARNWTPICAAITIFYCELKGAGLGKTGQIRYHFFREFLHIRGINSWIQQLVYFWLSVFQPCYALGFGHSGNSRKSLNKLACGKSKKKAVWGCIPGGLFLCLC
jgi:hypothetical protein